MQGGEGYRWANNRHFNASAGWVARMTVSMRKQFATARHPSPPIPLSWRTSINGSPHSRKRTQLKFKKSRMSFSAARAAENDGQLKSRP
jgi:hypothetical protein